MEAAAGDPARSPRARSLSVTAKQALGELRKRRLRGSLLEWSQVAVPILWPQASEPQRHHRLFVDYLERVERGEISRLIVSAPPGSAKSTYVTTAFSSWFMSRQAGRTVVGASATSEFAEWNSGRIVRLLAEAGPLLGMTLENDGVKAWRTSNRGEFKAVGVAGQVTGRRADLAIIDDPVPSREHADSEPLRDKTYTWYLSEILGRLTPGGRVVIVMTRYHEDDLAGRLLRSDPKGWTYLKIPAIAGEGDQLGRAPGEWLWDDDPRYAFGASLRQKHAELERNGALREWQSLYQQEPRPGEGALFKTAMLTRPEALLPVLPAGLKLVRAWDLAATAATGKNDPDWTVGALLGKWGDGRFLIGDIKRLRGGPDEVEAAIAATAEADGRSVTIKLSQDPGQAGKSQSLYLTRRLAGYHVVARRETGSKETRAEPFASQVNVGNVSMVRAPWNAALIDELDAFPSGAHDDQVDGLSAAFNELIAPPKPARWLNLNFMAR